MQEQGPNEERIISQATAAGLPLPRSIQNAPVLHMGLEIYLTGFLELNNSRSQGMGLGPISWTTIQDYCNQIGLDADETEDMHYHIGQLDIEWLRHQREKDKK